MASYLKKLVGIYATDTAINSLKSCIENCGQTAADDGYYWQLIGSCNRSIQQYRRRPTVSTYRLATIH